MWIATYSQRGLAVPKWTPSCLHHTVKTTARKSRICLWQWTSPDLCHRDLGSRRGTVSHPWVPKTLGLPSLIKKDKRQSRGGGVALWQSLVATEACGTVELLIKDAESLCSQGTDYSNRQKMIGWNIWAERRELWERLVKYKYVEVEGKTTCEGKRKKKNGRQD